MYQRDSREQPSLDCYIESRGGISRGEERPTASEEQLKTSKQLRSPLATSSCTAGNPSSSRTSQDIGKGLSQPHIIV